MKVFKILFSIFVVTVVALAYVHQQVELVKLSYAIDSKEKGVALLLDRKEKLVYNLNRLTSPSSLEKALFAKNSGLAYPDKENVIRVAAASGRRPAEFMRFAQVPRKGVMHNIIGLLGRGREAQAKENLPR